MSGGSPSDHPTVPLGSPDAPNLASLPAGTRVGRYALVRELARGASGVVYEARDVSLGRALALKLLDAPGGDVTHVARLRREAGLAARLRHPHVITIHEVGHAPIGDSARHVHFIAMDYLAGDTFAAARRGLDRERQVELLRQVADGVGHAHAHGVIHRDLKPSNILLSADERAVVTDFGLARGADSIRLTQTGQQLGTPLYMAPEQVAGPSEAVDARADVWALGVMLYETLTGRRPFRGPSIDSVYQQILRADPRPPRQLDPRLPRALESICLKALARDPARRYASAVEVAEELRRWLHGEPVQARPPGLLERAGRQLRRHPGRRAGAVAVLALLVPGLVLGGWRVQRTRRRAALVATARSAAERADWAAALAACRAGLDIRRGPDLAGLAARCTTELERAAAAVEARRAADVVDRARAEQLQQVRRLLRDTRPLLYRADADARGALARLARALEALDASPGAGGERWALLGSGWSLVGCDHRALSALTRAVAARPDDGWVHRDLAQVCLRQAQAVLLIPVPGGGRRDRPSHHWIARARTHLAAAASGWAGAREIDRHLVSAYAALAGGSTETLDALCAEGKRRFDGEPGAEAYWVLSGWNTTDVPRRLRDWSQALARRPHDAWIRVIRSATLIIMGDVAGARRDLDVALALNPNLAVGWVQRATMHQDGGDLAAAAAAMDRAVACAPGAAWVLCNRGAVRAARGDADGALVDYARALELDPDEVAARYNRGLMQLRAGKPAAALPDLEAVVRRRPSWVEAHIEKARALRQLRRVSEARSVHADIVRVAPRDPRGHFLQGVMHDADGDARAAYAAYTRAIEVDPRFGQAYHNRGGLRNRAGDIDGALADYGRAAELMPRTWSAHFNLGCTQFNKGLFGETIASMDRALKLAPRQPLPYTYRGAARVKLRLLSAALADLERAIELAPQESMSYLYRGLAYAGRGQTDEALADYQRAIELEPRDVEPVLFRGLLRRRLGQLAGARTDLRQATRMQPRLWQAWEGLGDVSWRLEERAEAVAAYRRAHALAPPKAQLRIAAWLARNTPEDDR